MQNIKIYYAIIIRRKKDRQLLHLRSIHFEQKIWAKSADGVRLDLKRLLQCSLGFLTLQEHVFFYYSSNQ